MFESLPVTTASPKWPRNTLLALQGLQLLSLGPWVMIGALSFMVFDAPGSEENKLLWAFVLAVWSYPLWLLLSGILSWVLLLTCRRRVAAVVLAGIFAIAALLLLLWIAVLTALTAWA